jgi:DHA1 family tetracycline resistance protein-like MFS transporter
MKRKGQLFPIILTVFLDLLGLGMVIPIAAPLLLSPATGMLPSGYGFSERSIVLGFLLGVFSIAQFIGAPVLGALADRYGRKKLLLLSIAGTLVGYILFAAGIIERSIVLCFASRLLDGFTGGNISIAMSAIADVTEEKDRAKNFGLIGMSFGLGFILGPFAGGVLSDPQLVSWFNYATPYLFAAILSLFNIGVMLLVFRETLVIHKAGAVRLWTGFSNLGKAFASRDTRNIFAVLFLLVFGFNFFTQFFQVFLIHKFSFTASDIAWLFAYIGLWLALAQGLVTRPLSQKYPPATLVSVTALLGAAVFPLLLLPHQSWWLYLIVPFIAVFNGVNTPNLTAVISMQADKDGQGSILGIRQSVLSAAMAIPPIIAGFITSVDVSLPIWAAGLSTFAGWALFRRCRVKRPAEKSKIRGREAVG